MLKLDYPLSIPTARINKAISYQGILLTITNGTVIIKKGFEWDGCTWARDGEKRWDGKPITADASCVHDALLWSLEHDKTFPLKKKVCDQILRDELIICRYKFLRIVPVKITAYMYYAGVRIFGSFFK